MQVVYLKNLKNIPKLKRKRNKTTFSMLKHSVAKETSNRITWPKQREIEGLLWPQFRIKMPLFRKIKPAKTFLGLRKIGAALTHQQTSGVESLFLEIKTEILRILWWAWRKLIQNHSSLSRIKLTLHKKERIALSSLRALSPWSAVRKSHSSHPLPKTLIPRATILQHPPPFTTLLL